MPERKSRYFDYQSMQDARSIAKYLQALIDGFEKQRIVFSFEGEEIVLTPEDLVKVSIKASKKDGKSELRIKVSWKETSAHLDDTIHIES